MATVPPMRSSVPLYDALAGDYDEHFAVPHRRAYDELSWRAVVEQLPTPRPDRPVVDAGCGVGRWAERLIELGHRVVGIEQAPRMAAAARRRGLGDPFELIESPMEAVQLPAGSAAAVVAMGSLQYTPDPAAVLRAFARWVSPGGVVAVLVDGLDALVAELEAAGRPEEAAERRRTRRGLWSAEGHAADLHLFDATTLAATMIAAGLEAVEVRGVLCGWTEFGREALMEELTASPDEVMAREAAWSREPAMADRGKQLLGLGRMPAPV